VIVRAGSPRRVTYHVPGIPDNNLGICMASHPDFFSFRPMLWVLAIWLLFIVSVWTHEDGKIAVIGLVLLGSISLLLFVFFLLYFAVQKHARRCFSYGAAIALFGSLYASGEQALRIADIAQLYAFHNYYDRCATSASSYGRGALAVCDRHDTDWRVEAVIYDSGGEITIPVNERSPEWMKVARSLDRAAPFGIEGFKATRISGRFYRVYFLPDQSVDF
jgi:hypothetical protein